MATLNVFKNQRLLNLEMSINDNLDHYKNADDGFFNNNGVGVLKSSYQVSDEPPYLDPNDSDESENAIRLFEYLSQIDNTAASDPRLWAYLAHVTFCKYASGRWGIAKSDDPGKAISQHFFTDGSARTLHRHAISRLWWGAKLTVAPWENNPFFEPLKKDDRFYYTKVLMQDQSISSDLLERTRISSSPELLITVLDFLDKNSGKNSNEDSDFRKRVYWRNFMKEVTLTLGYRKIMTMDLSSLQSELDNIAFEIKNRLKSSEEQE